MVIAIQGSLWVVFQPLLAAPLSARVSLPFHIHAEENFGKKKVQFGSTRVRARKVNAQSFNQFMFRDNFYKYRIILSLTTLNYIIKIMHN